MHPSTHERMSEFVEAWLTEREGSSVRILDIGSQDVNGSYRDLFERSDWSYVGADIEAGPNVDVVLSGPYRWRNIRSGSFDVVVSGQTLEHVEYPWLTMLEVARVLRPGGLCCVIVPSAGPEHQYPLDCWRMLPDGLKGLAGYAGLEVLEALRNSDLPSYQATRDVWNDCRLVTRKPERTPLGMRMRAAALQAMSG